MRLMSLTVIKPGSCAHKRGMHSTLVHPVSSVVPVKLLKKLDTAEGGVRKEEVAAGEEAEAVGGLSSEEAMTAVAVAAVARVVREAAARR